MGISVLILFRVSFLSPWMSHFLKKKNSYFPITTLQGENISEACFRETSSPQLPNSPPAGQLPPLLLKSPTTTESRVPLMLENSVIGEDTNSLPAEPPKQQLHVYSRLQPSQQIELNTSQANQRSEPEIEPEYDKQQSS